MDSQGDPQPGMHEPPTGIARLVRAALDASGEGRFEQAIAMLRGQVRTPGLAAGQNAEIRLALARVLLDAGRPKASVAELVQVLRIDAHRPDALLLLTEALLACGERSRAQEMLQRAQQSGGDSQRVAHLKMRLAGQEPPPSTSTTESIPVLLSDDTPTPRVAAELPPVLFDDDPTVPWIDTEEEDEPTHKIVPMIDAAPTQPLGWSIGDPGKAGVQAQRFPSVLFEDDGEEDTVTGSFQNISGESIRQADAQVQFYRAKNAQVKIPKTQTQHTIEVNLDDEDFAVLEQETPAALLEFGEDETTTNQQSPSPLAFDDDEETSRQVAAPRPAPRSFEDALPTTERTRQRPVARETPTENLVSAEFPTVKRRTPSPSVQVEDVDPVYQASTIEAAPVSPVQAHPPAPQREEPVTLTRQRRTTPAPAPEYVEPPRILQTPTPSRRPRPAPPSEKPRVVSSANLRAQLRNPSLDEKLSSLNEKRVAGRIDTARQIPAVPYEDDQNIDYRVKTLIPLTLGLCFLGLVLIGGLFVWPTIYQQSVMEEMEEHTNRARARMQSDTYQNYRQASTQLLQAINAKGPSVGAVAQWTEDYLAMLGTEDIQDQRLLARARLALVHSILEERFGTHPTPTTEDLLQDLDKLQVQTPEIQLAKTWRALGRGDHQRALQLAQDGLAKWPTEQSLRVMEGRAHTLAGERKLAQESYQEALRADNENVPALFEMGKWYAQNQDARALAHFNDILSNRSPDHEETGLERSLLLIAINRDLNEVQETYQTLIQKRADNISRRHLARAWYVKGRHEMVMMDQPGKTRTVLFQQAQQSLEKARNIDPTAPAPLFTLVELLAQEGRLEQANELLASASKQFRPGASQKRLAALLALKKGRVEQALKILGKVAQGDSQGQALRGTILLELERWAEADAAFEAASKAGSRNNIAADRFFARAAGQRDKKGLDYLRGALEKSPNSAKAHARMGRTLLAHGKARAALPYLLRADDIDAEGTYRHRFPPAADVCKAYIELVEWDKAQRACASAVTLRPAYLPGRVALAKVELWRGDWEEAIAQCQRGLQLHPEHTGLRRLLAEARIMRGDMRDAEKLLRTLIKQEKQDSAASQELQGMLHMKKRHYGQALGFFKKAHAKAPSPKLALDIAWSLLELNKPNEAAPYLNDHLKNTLWRGPVLVAQAEIARQKEDWRKAASKASSGIRELKRKQYAKWRIGRAYHVLAGAYALRYGITHPRATDPLTKAARYDHAPALYLKARNARSRRRGRSDALPYLRKAVQSDPWYCPAVRDLRGMDPKNAESIQSCL